MNQIEKKESATIFTPKRLEALTDGVFAIVMTLLVLEISVPEIAQSSRHTELPQRLLELWPKLLSYFISFVILGIFWYLHHFAFRYIKQSDDRLIWLNIFFLMFVALIPFSTSLFGSYPKEQLPLIIYVTNMIFVGIMRFALWAYATGKYRLVDRDISPRLIKWDRLVSIGFLFIFGLIIGVSFINAAAARSIFALLGVFGFALLFTTRRLEQ
ncbi:MAG TPA: DUF1211 domain-containing protein [Dehalococcoidia bacterium]|nr:DUF1211 domain-containing protein [Dehalococcoidia bacterium]